MTLYRHYKNLPYRLLDVVKHSETQEDLVLYETLYENEGGRLWVRPKSMFFESVTVGGEVKPRFSKTELAIQAYTEFTPELRAEINRIGRKCFDVWDDGHLAIRTADKQKLLILIGSFDGRPVAFKIGYELSASTYYSWLGGVDPDYHRFGFAYALSETQHLWCVGEGYDAIRTKCLNFNLPMLRLNLKLGFLVVDTELTEQGLKLLLEKRIRERLA